MATPGQSTDLTDFKSLVLAGATEDPEAIVELAKRYSSKLMSYAGSLGVDDPAQATQVALITALKAVDVAKPPSENRFEAEMFRAIRMGSSIEQGRPNGRTDTTSADGNDDGSTRPPTIHAAGPIDVATTSQTPPPAATRPPPSTAPPSIDPELLPPDFDPDLPLSEPVQAATAVDPDQTVRTPTAEPAATPAPPRQVDSIPAPPEPPNSSMNRIEPDPTITADPIEPDAIPVPDQSPTVQPLQTAQTTLDEPATVDESAPTEEQPNERVIANDVEVDDEVDDEFTQPGVWPKTTDLAPPRAMPAPQDVTRTDEHPLTPAGPTGADLHDPRPPSLEPVDLEPPEGRGVFDVPVMGGAASTGAPATIDPGVGPETVGGFAADRPPADGLGAVEIGVLDEGVVDRGDPVPGSDLLDTAQYDAVPEDVTYVEDGGYPGDYDTPDGYDTLNGYGPEGYDTYDGYGPDGYGADPYEATPAVGAFDEGDQVLDEYLPAESLPSVEPLADEAEILVDRRQPYVERRAPRTETGRAPTRRPERRDRTDGRYNPVEDIGADPQASDNGRLKLLLLAAGPALLVVGLTIYLVTIQSDSLATRAPVPADGNLTATTTEPDSAGERATFGTEANAEPDTDADADAGETTATTVGTDDPTEPNVATSVTVTVEDNGTATGGDFSGETLVNVNLADTDLAGADFSGSSLTNVDLSGADLVGADFTDAVLTDVNFERAEISGADFTGATQIRSPINGRWNPNDPPTLP